MNYSVNIPNLVNYIDVPTQAANEMYVAGTDVPDSLSFLIKNNFLIELSFPPVTDPMKDGVAENYPKNK